jgi:hypothetical protein
LSATDNCVDSSPDFKYGRLLNWFRLNIGLWSSTPPLQDATLSE